MRYLSGLRRASRGLAFRGHPAFTVASAFTTRSAPQLQELQQEQSLPPVLPGLSPAQIDKIAKSDGELRNRHVAIEGEMDAVERDTVRRKRMIYRSKQRGWLEADLLLGSWAVKNVPTLTVEELDQYELLLKEETIDIYNYVSGKDVLPDHLKDLPVMKKLQGYALTQNMASPEAYESVKKETNLT